MCVAQSLLARAPQASTETPPMIPGTIAEMQPRGSGGLVLPAVTTISAIIATVVIVTAAIATLRSRVVSFRNGVLTRCQCPSIGMAAQVSDSR